MVVRTRHNVKFILLSLLLNVGSAIFVTMYLVKSYKLHRFTQNKVDSEVKRAVGITDRIREDEGPCQRYRG